MLYKGQVLRTKDGRIIGNAIIFDIVVESVLLEETYKVKTDFGNIVALTERLIRDAFYVDSPIIIYEPNVQLDNQIKLLGKFTEVYYGNKTP